LIFYDFNQKENEDELLQKLLIEHPEMGFLEIPPGINSSTGNNSYKVSTRITKPIILIIIFQLLFFQVVYRLLYVVCIVHKID
jgi:hypothetical protein